MEIVWWNGDDIWKIELLIVIVIWLWINELLMLLGIL